MQIRKYITNLHGPFDYLIFGLRTILIQNFIQGFSFNKIHNNVDGRPVINNVYNSRQCRMIQPLYHIGLCQQTIYNNLVIFAVAFLADLLDCPVSVKMCIIRKVYNGHTAPTDFLQYFIFSLNYRSNTSHICHLLFCFNQNHGDIIFLLAALDLFNQVFHVAVHFFFIDQINRI